MENRSTMAHRQPAHQEGERVELGGSGMRRRTRRLAVAAVGAALVLGGCAADAPQDTFRNEGSQADEIARLDFIYPLAFGVAALVCLIVVVLMVKFRAKRYDPTDLPSQVHGNTKLELGWTIAPAVLLAGVAVPTVSVLFNLADRPDDAMRIDVIGQQWWWEFDYPEFGIVTANEMVFPAGQKVVVNITSRDVNHSFWFPRLNGKKDAVPNRIHTLTMEADEPGEYYGQCVEFCGLSHANMRMRAIALSPADWEAWVAAQQKPAAQPEEGTAAFRGMEQVSARCTSCHLIDDGEGGVTELADRAAQVSGAAPNLTHFMSRTTFAGSLFEMQNDACRTAREAASESGDMSKYMAGTSAECLNRTQLEAWLRNSPAEKPMYPPLRGMPAQGLTEDQIDDVVEYLLTLK
jgi:cytochrome c oxidase subunit 2